MRIALRSCFVLLFVASPWACGDDAATENGVTAGASGSAGTMAGSAGTSGDGGDAGTSGHGGDAGNGSNLAGSGGSGAAAGGEAGAAGAGGGSAGDGGAGNAGDGGNSGAGDGGSAVEAGSGGDSGNSGNSGSAGDGGSDAGNSGSAGEAGNGGGSSAGSGGSAGEGGSDAGNSGNAGEGGSGGEPCANSLALCGNACVDLQTDHAHCGACDSVCETKCTSGACLQAVGGDAGGDSTCVLLDNEKLRCWGRNNYAQLGYGHTNNIGDDELPATAGDVNVGSAATQIRLGAQFGCALLASGDVKCWGVNSFGQTGSGSSGNVGVGVSPASLSTVDVGGKIIGLGGGTNHTCAILEGGKLRCWGWNQSGQLGYGNSKNIGDDETPASAGDVDIAGKVVQIVGGINFTCVLLDTGKVRCWGNSGFGQLGYGNKNSIGNTKTAAVAGDVDIGGTVLQLAAGSYHTCALLEGGNVRCWGANSYGQLGYLHSNDIGDDELPSTAGDVKVGGLVAELAAGSYHTCARLTTGKVRCWGRNTEGQLGYATTLSVRDAQSPVAPGDVQGIDAAIKLFAGLEHQCAVLASGNVKCWGTNAYGQLGYGNKLTIGDDETPASAGNVQLF